MDKISTDRRLRGPLILAVLTAAAGIVISVYLQNRTAQTEAAAARLTAETLRLNTEQELTLFADVLESICALHALSDAVDQAAMNEFIEKGMVYQHAVLGTFGLTQRIDPQIRSMLERQSESTPGAGYRVVQQGPDGTWVPAEFKPVYYPLTWQSRSNGLNIPLGFDLSSLGEEAHRTIGKIERTRRTALVPSPIPRKQMPDERGQNIPPISDGSAYWVFAPVVPGRTGGGYAPNSVIGFAVAVLHPEAVLKRVAALSVPSPGLRMSLTVSPETEIKETVRLTNGAWLYRHRLEAIGTPWIFECSLPAVATGRRSTATLVAGLVITALMTSQLLVLGGRTRKIEAVVRARTEDLRIANARLEENLHERMRLEEEMNELAAKEQRRIGRDLHDSLGQKLTGAVFLSRSLLDYLSSEDGRPRTEDRSQQSEIPNRQSSIDNQKTHARTLNETLKSAVSQVRNMARGLAPVTLNDESLCEALEQLAEEMTGLYGVSCEVARCDELPALDRKTKEQLYLVTREAVNNAARHAQAAHVTVRLTGSESGWNLCVEDNGKGLPELQPAAEGMGIRIMRHRAGLIGAQFTLTSTQGRGTCVEVHT